MSPARDLNPARDLSSTRDLTPWPLYMPIVQLNSIRCVEWIKHLFMVLPKAQLFQSVENL